MTCSGIHCKCLCILCLTYLSVLSSDEPIFDPFILPSGVPARDGFQSVDAFSQQLSPSFGVPFLVRQSQVGMELFETDRLENPLRVSACPVNSNNIHNIHEIEIVSSNCVERVAYSNDLE